MEKANHLLTAVRAFIAAVFFCSIALPASGQNKAVARNSNGSSKDALLGFTGEYTPMKADGKMTSMSIVEYKGSLYRHVTGNYVHLSPAGANAFLYDDNSGRKVAFRMDARQTATAVTLSRPDGVFTFTRSQPGSMQFIAPPGNSLERVDRLMKSYADFGQFSGSVLVSDNGRVIYEKAFGMADEEWDIPNTIDTKFRLGSITKQFTAMLALMLVEQGKLKLDEPIVTYLPDYPAEQGRKITMHHLLSHTSGIPNFTSDPGYRDKIMRNPYSSAEIVKLFADKPLEFEPGSKFEYSNSGYNLAGYVIEKISGKTYEDCLQEWILRPLKMSNTGYDHRETILKKRASGYDRDLAEVSNASYIDMSVPFAAGAIYSTVGDLYLLDQALYTEVPMSAGSKKLLFGRHAATGAAHYGYGWFIADQCVAKPDQPVEVIEHGGGINGFNTLLTRVPAEKQAVILLNNTGGAELQQIKDAILAILNDRPYDMPKISLAAKAAALIKSDGLPAAMRILKELKSSADYVLREGEFNALGYLYLQRNKVEEAIAMFSFNVDQFPLSANCYDSLGEAYLKKGDKELAIFNYKRSVELDPANENGKSVIKKLSE